MGKLHHSSASLCWGCTCSVRTYRAGALMLYTAFSELRRQHRGSSTTHWASFVLVVLVNEQTSNAKYSVEGKRSGGGWLWGRGCTVVRSKRTRVVKLPTKTHALSSSRKFTRLDARYAEKNRMRCRRFRPMPPPGVSRQQQLVVRTSTSLWGSRDSLCDASQHLSTLA